MEVFCSDYHLGITQKSKTFPVLQRSQSQKFSNLLIANTERLGIKER